jgi:hypothetical protein
MPTEGDTMSTGPLSFDDAFAARAARRAVAQTAADHVATDRVARDRPAARRARILVQESIELRPATTDDADALRTIAERDSASVPPGPLVLAETAGTPLAAISLATGEVIADPFWPTAAAVQALRGFAHGRRRRRWLGLARS